MVALERYHILDTPAEPDFDEVTQLASALCEAPISVINLIDRDRQWFKSEVGLGVRQTPLDTSICAHAILQDDFVLVPDTLEDARFRDNPLCRSDPNLRFYAGARLMTPDGYPIGTLCVLDHHPRQLSSLQRQAMTTLARQVMAQMELRRALARQQELGAELAQESARKDEFLAMLSHELRNPLAPIVSALQVLDRTDAPEGPVRMARGVISRQVGQLRRLVDDLLDIARVRGGKMTLRRAPVPIAAVVERAVEISQPLIEARGHRFTAEVPPDVPPVLVDEVRLAQVVSNLLTNAARYTPNGGAIRLKVAQAGRRLSIGVADNGAGISPEHLERIFELFNQAAEPRSFGGLGIGLTLARRLVELHGGTLTAASEGLGSGSTFTVELPLA